MNDILNLTEVGEKFFWKGHWYLKINEYKAAMIIEDLEDIYGDVPSVPVIN